MSPPIQHSSFDSSMRCVAYSHPRPMPEASYPFHVEQHVRGGTALPQPGSLRDRNGYIITWWQGQNRSSGCSPSGEEGMSFGMTSAQSGSDTLCTGVHTSLSPSCVDKCDIMRAVLFPDVEWRGLRPGLQAVWGVHTTPICG